MSPETSEHRVCRFGLYEADLDAGILKRHGIPVKLQEQPFRILGFLLERPGEIISREELRNRLWPEGTFVEFDGSLNTALMKLRAVLNDDPENPRFVETVPKKGYRFIAPVQVVRGQNDFAEAEAVEPAAAAANAEFPPSSLDRADRLTPRPHETVKRRDVSLVGMVFFLAGIVVAAAIVWRYWPMPEPRVLKVSQLTHTGRVIPGSRIVTDGARLYFVSREGGHSVLMTTSIHGGSVEKLISPFEDAVIFDVSPDRTQLLIGPVDYEDEEIPVWMWPAHGGVPHRLGDVTASEAVWSPVGDSIAIIEGNRLLTVRPDGSNTKELQKFSANPPYSLVWSADGAKLRFTVSNPDLATDEMLEIGADGTNLRRVLPSAPAERHDTTGTWSTDERYFLFTRGSDSRLNRVMDSVSNVWASHERRGFLSRAKHQSTELTNGPISFHSLADTGDSKRFFALGTHPEYQLIRMNPLTTAYDVILPDAGATDVDVTAEGEWLVYSLRENGALWKSRRNGKERVELTASAPGALAPQWSPDGKEVLFTAFFLDKKPQLYVVPSAGGIPHAILPGADGSSQSGDWSPDGKQILFDYSEQGESNLRILDRASAKTEILPDSRQLEQARWSPDGKHIAAINGKTRQIVLYTLDQRKWSVLAEPVNAQGMRWSTDGNSIYYQEMGDAEQAVYRLRLGRALPEKVLGFGRMLGSMASQCHFTGVAPDGSVYATVDRGGTDVYALDLKLP